MGVLSEPSRNQDNVARLAARAAIVVHAALGPGLLESVYEDCLAYELSSQGLSVRRQLRIPIRYRSQELDTGFRLDLLVEDLLIIEVKATEKFLPLHEAQILTYLKLSGHSLGLLMNFNVTRMKYGLKRFVRSRSAPVD